MENVFGILVNRFGVLKSKISLSHENTEDAIFACCVLHNFLQKNAPDKYPPHGSLDAEGEGHEIQEGLRAAQTNIAAMGLSASKKPVDEAKELRDAYKEYFNNEGANEWQNRFI